MHKFLIKNLTQNLEVFQYLLTDIDEEMFKWKSSPEQWSLLEIACHLHDEEREDFRVRLKLVLEYPEQDPPPINPPKWVTERDYIHQNFETMVFRFLSERRESISWLESLDNPKWDNVYQHKKFGPMSGTFYLTNWLAHDYLHIRQITRVKYDYAHWFSGIPLDYAGTWK